MQMKLEFERELYETKVNRHPAAKAEQSQQGGGASLRARASSREPRAASLSLRAPKDSRQKIQKRA